MFLGVVHILRNTICDSFAQFTPTPNRALRNMWTASSHENGKSEYYYQFKASYQINKKIFFEIE